MAYELRINYFCKNAKGEGEFWWIKDSDILEYQKEYDTNYTINPYHWSTVVYELVLYKVLPALTGKNDWHLGEASDGFNGSEFPFAQAFTDNGESAIIELQDEEGLCRWAPEDQIPNDRPKIMVFTGRKEIPCNTPKEAAYVLGREIADLCSPYRHYHLAARK